MTLSQKILLLILVALGIICFGLYYFYYSHGVRIVNNSKYYTLSYRQSSLFDSYLDQFTIRTSPFAFNLNFRRLVIELTDIPQKGYEFYGQTTVGGTNYLLRSTNITQTKNGDILMKLYISPDLKNDELKVFWDQINGHVLHTVLNSLELNINKTPSAKKTHDLLRKATDDFIKGNNNTPFVVIIKK